MKATSNRRHRYKVVTVIVRQTPRTTPRENLPSIVEDYITISAGGSRTLPCPTADEQARGEHGDED